MTADWVTGDALGLAIPAHPDAMREGGTAFLTAAFRAFGTLTAGNGVRRITRFEEVGGGSTGRKLLLSVEYERPETGLHTELFVKFSRDHTDPVRDHGRTQMQFEVRFAELSRDRGFPIAVPKCQFADYHADSGTGLLISERIPFGRNGIEPQHHKCLDYEMPQPLEHYRALVSSLATLVGTHKAGRLPSHLADRFPVQIQGVGVGGRTSVTPEKLQRRVTQYGELAAQNPGLLPANVRSPAFISRLSTDAVRFAEQEPTIWRHLAADPDHIALCHWNANVDNAWFWRGGDNLHCGLMDWGGVGQMNVAMALWGAMSGAETSMWDHHLDDLVSLFAAQVRRCGGPLLDADVITRNLMLYVALMGVTWLLNVPALLRIRVPDLTGVTSRLDPRVKEDEGVRAPLQMLTNMLNLWEAHDFGAVLDSLIPADS